VTGGAFSGLTIDGDYHGGGSGWRFSWRIDRLQKLHELGRAFGLTDGSEQPVGPIVPIHETQDRSSA
jgi:hypothetical protein